MDLSQRQRSTQSSTQDKTSPPRFMAPTVSSSAGQQPSTKPEDHEVGRKGLTKSLATVQTAKKASKWMASAASAVGFRRVRKQPTELTERSNISPKDSTEQAEPAKPIHDVKPKHPRPTRTSMLREALHSTKRNYSSSDIQDHMKALLSHKESSLPGVERYSGPKPTVLSKKSRGGAKIQKTEGEPSKATPMQLSLSSPKLIADLNVGESDPAYHGRALEAVGSSKSSVRAGKQIDTQANFSATDAPSDSEDAHPTAAKGAQDLAPYANIRSRSEHSLGPKAAAHRTDTQLTSALAYHQRKALVKGDTPSKTRLGPRKLVIEGSEAAKTKKPSPLTSTLNTEDPFTDEFSPAGLSKSSLKDIAFSKTSRAAPLSEAEWVSSGAGKRNKVPAQSTSAKQVNPLNRTGKSVSTRSVRTARDDHGFSNQSNHKDSLNSATDVTTKERQLVKVPTGAPLRTPRRSTRTEITISPSFEARQDRLGAARGVSSRDVSHAISPNSVFIKDELIDPSLPESPTKAVSDNASTGRVISSVRGLLQRGIPFPGSPRRPARLNAGRAAAAAGSSSSNNNNNNNNNTATAIKPTILPDIATVHPCHRPQAHFGPARTPDAPGPSTGGQQLTPYTPVSASVDQDLSSATRVALDMMNDSVDAADPSRAATLLRLAQLLAAAVDKANDARIHAEQATRAARRADIDVALLAQQVKDMARLARRLQGKKE